MFTNTRSSFTRLFYWRTSKNNWASDLHYITKIPVFAESNPFIFSKRLKQSTKNTEFRTKTNFLIQKRRFCFILTKQQIFILIKHANSNEFSDVDLNNKKVKLLINYFCTMNFIPAKELPTYIIWLGYSVIIWTVKFNTLMETFINIRGLVVDRKVKLV